MGLYEGKVNREQLLKHLTERWREAIERKLFVGILSVDLTKAFDTVSHNTILRKLNDLGIRRDIWLWLKNYLTERKHFVRINGCDSDTHVIAHGMPQGSVLRPTFSRSLQATSQNHYALRKLICMQTTNNILYRRNDGIANKHTRQCSSRTPGMLRQKFVSTTPRKM